jgi:uncharacterized protein YndB with AHSA1/START domain
MSKLVPALTIGVLLTMNVGLSYGGGGSTERGNQPSLTGDKSPSGGSTMDDSFSIIITRDMKVSADQVWDAWNSPEKIAKWWGPAGFSSTVKQLDVRDGGRFEVIMHGPDGRDYPNLYVFDHVEKRKQLVYTNTGSKEYGLAPFQSVFDIEEIGNRTRVTLKARFSTEEDKRKHVEQFHAIEGAQQLLQRLEEQAK